MQLVLARGTYLQAEEYAYPNGAQTRKGSAIFPDGKVRRVWAGIPDTFFTIPAHARLKSRYVAGYLSMDGSDGALLFQPTCYQQVQAVESPAP